MTNPITFETNSTTYFTSGNGYYYAETNGIKFRISKAKFEQAHTQYIEEASREAEEALAVEEALEAVAEAEAQGKPKKANKKRIPKNVGYRKTFDNLEGIEVVLTEKQVDFIRHLPDTCYWENGLDSAIWVDCLCDEIGGQFAGKPMTVGAMISTICEKGLGMRGRDRINGRKCTSFALSELGKMVAKDLGL